MAGTAGTKGVPRPVREAQILDVAAAEIGRVGYAGLSPATVAAKAEVSKPLVYSYFESKDGLYAACVRRAATVIGDAVDQALEPVPESDAAAKLATAERVLTAVFTALEPRPLDWQVLFDRSCPDHGPAAAAAQDGRRRIAVQARHGVGAFLADRGVTDPGDVSALTAVWQGAVSALVDWWLRHPEETATEMVARSRRLLDALG